MHTAVDELNSAIIRSYPEILGSAGWGMLCYNEGEALINTLVGEVICRQTKNMFLSKISRAGHPAGVTGRAFYAGTINCTGDEAKISECSIELEPSGWCPEKYTTIGCTTGGIEQCTVWYMLNLSIQMYAEIPGGFLVQQCQHNYMRIHRCS